MGVITIRIFGSKSPNPRYRTISGYVQVLGLARDEVKALIKHDRKLIYSNVATDKTPIILEKEFEIDYDSVMDEVNEIKRAQGVIINSAMAIINIMTTDLGYKVHATPNQPTISGNEINWIWTLEK